MTCKSDPVRNFDFPGEKRLKEQDRLDLMTALGEECCDVLAPVVGVEMCPQDGYKAFVRVLATEFGVESLRLLSDSQVDELRATAVKLLECASIKKMHLQEVIRRTLWRAG